MSEKVHQCSNTQYQVRVDGKPIYHPFSIDTDAMERWLKACQENPGCYVDIVSIRTEVIMGQFNYDCLKKHFAG